MATPLKKVSLKDNKPYQRRPAVEEKINELEGDSIQNLVHECCNFNNPLPLEVMLYFLRNKSSSLTQNYFIKIFNSFFIRIETALKNKISDKKFYKAEEIRQEIMDRLSEIIAVDRNGDETRLDYFEVNFNSAFAKLRIDVLRQIGPARKSDPLHKATSLTGDGIDDTDVLPEIEQKIIDDFSLEKSLLDDIDFRFRLFDAINVLPEDERIAIGLFLQGLPIEAKDPSICTISGALGCTPRTVNNRLHRAYVSLKGNLLVEQIQ